MAFNSKGIKNLNSRLRKRFGRGRQRRRIRVTSEAIKYEGGRSFAEVVSPIEDGQVLYLQPIVFTPPELANDVDFRKFPNISAEAIVSAAYNTIRGYVKGPLAAKVAAEFDSRPYNTYGIQVGKGSSREGEIHPNAEHTKKGFQDLKKTLMMEGEYQEGGQMIIGLGPEERVLGLNSANYSFNGTNDNTFGVWFMNVEFGTGQFTQTFRRVSGEFKPPSSEGEWFMKKYTIGDKPDDQREDGGPVDPLQARIDTLDEISREWVLSKSTDKERREALGLLLGQQLDLKAEARGESSFADQETLEQGFFGAKVFGQLPFHLFFDTSGEFKEKYWQKVIAETLPPYWKQHFEKNLRAELGE